MFFEDTFVSKACADPVIAPTNFSAKETGAYHASLRWFKPMDDSYDYKVSYTAEGQTEAPMTATGHTAFGPMFGYQAYDLREQTKYTFTLQHVCKDDPAKTSADVTATATTLDAGEYYLLW